MSNVINLKGHRFERLRVRKFKGIGIHGSALWECICDCGNKKIIISSHLRSGKTRSCGCFQKDHVLRLNKSRIIHGLSRTKMHRVWRSMIDRCENPKSRDYKNYGGRGIYICKRWHKFLNWYADMGKRPTSKHSIERIKNDGDYKPQNCRWATRKEQNLNSRRNRLITFRGVTKTLGQWADYKGIAADALRSRLNNGWPVEKALVTPVNPNRQRQ